MGKFLLLSFAEHEERVLNNILSILQKENIHHHSAEDVLKNSKLKYQDIEIDLGYRKILCGSQEVNLTYTEFEILHLLARSPGRVFSKEQIYNQVWEEPVCGDCSIVMSHIRHIREKIGDCTKNPRYIQTVWGIGYRFNKEESSNQ